jgi:hypothetical protein
MFLFFLILADSNANNLRSSQAFLDDEWEPEPIEALTGKFNQK